MVQVIVAYTLGSTSGVGHGHNAGLFGTAVATMGMLSSAGAYRIFPCPHAHCRVTFVAACRT